MASLQTPPFETSVFKNVVPQDLSTGTGCSYSQRAMWTNRGGNVCVCSRACPSTLQTQSMLNIPEAVYVRVSEVVRYEIRSHVC